MVVVVVVVMVRWGGDIRVIVITGGQDELACSF